MMVLFGLDFGGWVMDELNLFRGGGRVGCLVVDSFVESKVFAFHCSYFWLRFLCISKKVGFGLFEEVPKIWGPK